jgi:hypothetical protein
VKHYATFVEASIFDKTSKAQAIKIKIKQMGLL